MEYAVDIYAGPRLAYATAGWEVYLDHPVTGVGLGASGLYLYDHIPDWSVTTLSEITRQLTPNGWLYPNPKNLYIRLLGGNRDRWVHFVSSLLAGYPGDRDPIIPKWIIRFIRILGVGGVFIWFVLIFFNFTQDSFIDPNQWLGLGLLLGVCAAICFAKRYQPGSNHSQE